MGKTAPIDPNRTFSANIPIEDRTYPNRWMEERNLRSFHKNNGKGVGNSMSVERNAFGNNNMSATQLNILNQKYLAVSYNIFDHLIFC